MKGRPVFDQKLFFVIVFLLFFSKTGYCDIFAYRDKKGVLHIENKPTSNVPRRLLLKEQPQYGKTSWKKKDTQRIIRLIHRISVKEGVDPALAKAIAHAESAFNPKAKSPKGAIGVMQLMPETASRFYVKNIYNEEENVRGGILYLRYLLKLFNNNLRWAVAAYNAGEQKVIQSKGIPPIKETERFVDRVFAFYSKYKKMGWGKPVKKIIDKNGRIYLTNM